MCYPREDAGGVIRGLGRAFLCAIYLTILLTIYLVRLALELLERAGDGALHDDDVLLVQMRCRCHEVRCAMSESAG